MNEHEYWQCNAEPGSVVCICLVRLNHQSLPSTYLRMARHTLFARLNPQSKSHTWDYGGTNQCNTYWISYVVADSTWVIHHGNISRLTILLLVSQAYNNVLASQRRTSGSHSLKRHVVCTLAYCFILNSSMIGFDDGSAFYFNENTVRGKLSNLSALISAWPYISLWYRLYLHYLNFNNHKMEIIKHETENK